MRSGRSRDVRELGVAFPAVPRCISRRPGHIVDRLMASACSSVRPRAGTGDNWGFLESLLPQTRFQVRCSGNTTTRKDMIRPCSLFHWAANGAALARGLADVLNKPPADPFAKEVVAVPAKGVERWLAQPLSHVLGALADYGGVRQCRVPVAQHAARRRRRPVCVGGARGRGRAVGTAAVGVAASGGRRRVRSDRGMVPHPKSASRL